MTPTDLAAALERMAAQTHYETGDVLREAARVLREVAEMAKTLDHAPWCECRGAARYPNLACTCEAGKVTCNACFPCDCGLDALRRAMGGT